ncbi:MAG: hypothetical protein ACRBFS_07500 [Aureispira sp.]
MSNIKQQTDWVHYLRVIATIAVILLHVSAPSAATYTLDRFSYWVIGNLFDGSVRWCVPIFLCYLVSYY